MKKRIRNMDLNLLVVPYNLKQNEIRKEAQAFRAKIANDLKLARVMQCANA